MTKQDDKPGKQAERVVFHWIKSNAFRVIHAEGAHGGITPNGKIQMALFNERQPIPQQTSHEVEKASDGSFKVGDEMRDERVSRNGIVREVEVEILMDPKTARLVCDWLEKQLVTLEKLEKELGERSAIS